MIQVQGVKMVARGVTAVEATWLPELAPSFFTSRTPLVQDAS